MDEHDRIDLIEPPEGHAYAVGDEITYRHERWRIDQIAQSPSAEFALRLACSRVLPWASVLSPDPR